MQMCRAAHCLKHLLCCAVASASCQVGSNIEVPVPVDESGGDDQVTTLGTATVYRSKTQKLEGGEGCGRQLYVFNW